MPVCCRCSASGRCKNCSCKKSNRECSNCLPSRRGHCHNTGTPATSPYAVPQSAPTEPESASTVPAGDPASTEPVPRTESIPATDTVFPLESAQMEPNPTTELVSLTEFVHMEPVSIIEPGTATEPTPLKEHDPMEIEHVPPTEYVPITGPLEPVPMEFVVPGAESASYNWIPNASSNICPIVQPMLQPTFTNKTTMVIESSHPTETTIEQESAFHHTIPSPPTFHQPHGENEGATSTSIDYTIDNLPPFVPTPAPKFQWGGKTSQEFTRDIELAYEQVVHWKRNLFKVPSGKAGKLLVSELTRMFRAYSDGSALECIALKAAMIMPALLLQKSHPKSKAKDHTKHLARRLQLWTEGDLESLLNEGRTIQRQFTQQRHSHVKSTEQTARTFAKLMMEGKVRAALRLVAENSGGGPLSLESLVASNSTSTTPVTVREVLQQKHPPKQPPTHLSIDTPNTSDTPRTEPHPILFDKIDGQLIRNTVLRMDGAAGPSGLDAAAWKRLCTSFKTASADLCESLASIAKRICTSYVDPSGLSAFVSCRLIALDKCPGVRPIGIGEMVRRIIGKAIATTISDDIQAAAGPLQVCAGQVAGCEAAVHTMRQVFESPQSEAIILVDASNAFNSLNRQVALRNIHHLCPSLSKVLINTYREDIQLFIDGDTLFSQEGTTQGDPLAMVMYAIAVTPLIHQLEDSTIKQVWFADDATAGGNLVNLKEWWERIVQLGPNYGYHPNASKTWLIVKEGHLEEARSIFAESGVAITAEGRRHLGGAIGTPTFVESYVRQKVSGWEKEIESLSSIATTQPHAAYAAFTHGISSRWTYLSRTIPHIADLLKPLEDTIRQKFLPSLTGREAFNDELRDLLALPVRLGGLGIIDPSRQTKCQHNTSEKISAPLVALILQQSCIYSAEDKATQMKAKNNARTHRRQLDQATAIELQHKLPTNLQRAMMASSEKGASSWLSVLPIDEHGFALHKGAFRDALCLRYGWRPQHLPSHCVCDHQFTVEHALSCSRGGFPSIRHNEIRDITADLLSEVCHNVGTEPCLQPVTGEQLTYRTANREDDARLDVVAQSFWGRDRQRAFFDVRVFNPFAQSYLNTPLAQCYRRNELEKKRAYDERVREIERGSFSPLVFSTSGGMGKTATVVYKRLATLHADKFDKPYSKTIHWLRCRMNFSLLRSSIMCLRGSRSAVHRPASPLIPGDIDLACAEGRVPNQD